MIDCRRDHLNNPESRLLLTGHVRSGAVIDAQAGTSPVICVEIPAHVLTELLRQPVPVAEPTKVKLIVKASDSDVHVWPVQRTPRHDHRRARPAVHHSKAGRRPPGARTPRVTRTMDEPGEPHPFLRALGDLGRRMFFGD
jgi:hypothetical protein